MELNNAKLNYMQLSTLINIAFRYDAILTRYARILTGSKPAADSISMAVFEMYYNAAIELDESALRAYLLWAVKERCIKWKMANAVWH
ncbi:hypothetical protein EGI32_00735 [Ferruginibacter sp. HRS2-29]|nr:hypothetical protein [Ferruginibacter sp. HRS2-29]